MPDFISVVRILSGATCTGRVPSLERNLESDLLFFLICPSGEPFKTGVIMSTEERQRVTNNKKASVSLWLYTVRSGAEKCTFFFFYKRSA